MESRNLTEQDKNIAWLSCHKIHNNLNVIKQENQCQCCALDIFDFFM